jgi:hypothetical protein
MSTCAQLRHQLEGLQDMIDKRGDTARRLQAPTCTSLVRKIAVLKDLDAEQTLELTELADAALGDHASSFEHALHARLEDGLVADAKTTATGQLLEELDEYLTAQDYRDCGPTSTPMGRELCVQNRLSALGVTKLHPRTIRAAIAALVHLETDITLKFPSYDTIYQDVQTFSRNFPPKPAPPHALNVYPRAPVDLPKHVFDAAYSTDDPPVASMMPRFRAISLGHIPLRSTSKLLSWNQARAGGRHAQCMADTPPSRLALCDRSRNVMQLGTLRGSDHDANALVRCGRSPGQRGAQGAQYDTDDEQQRGARDRQMQLRMDELQQQVRTLQSNKRDVPPAICDGSPSPNGAEHLKPPARSVRSRVSPEGLNSLYSESAKRQDTAHDQDRASNVAVSSHGVAQRARVDGKDGAEFGTEEAEEQQLKALMDKEKRSKVEAQAKRKAKQDVEKALRRPACAIVAAPARRLRSKCAAPAEPRVAKCAGDPWLALGHKSLLTSLAHILNADALAKSPSMGAFCTKGSTSAKALAKNKKAMTVDGVKAAGAHGWALCRQYWLDNKD